MRDYELMIIFNEDEIPFNDNKSSISTLLSENKVEIKEEKDYGNRELAYPINEKKRGHYYLFVIKSEQSALTKLENSFKLNRGILRYLIVRQK